MAGGAPGLPDTPWPAMANAKKLSVEVHKFGGASLADGVAFRRVVEIIAGRQGPRVAVVSAPAGVTDLLLGLAGRATGARPAWTARWPSSTAGTWRSCAARP